MTLEQAARAFGWGELTNFAKHLPMDSATFRAKHEDAASFAAELKQSAMIADLIDGVTALCYMISKTHGGKPQKPKPYPRPWVDSGAKRIGSNPIPISQFNDWYYGGE